MSFADDLKRITDNAKANGHLIVGKIVEDIGRRLVLKSPVGDAKYWKRQPPPSYVGGRFRANWQLGVGEANVTTNTNVDASGRSSIDRISVGIPEQAAGKVYYITNSLPYAIRLEEGHSRQAPQGMVRLTVLEFEPIVAAAARAINK